MSAVAASIFANKTNMVSAFAGELFVCQAKKDVESEFSEKVSLGVGNRLLRTDNKFFLVKETESNGKCCESAISASLNVAPPPSAAQAIREIVAKDIAALSPAQFDEFKPMCTDPRQPAPPSALASPAAYADYFRRANNGTFPWFEAPHLVLLANRLRRSFRVVVFDSQRAIQSAYDISGRVAGAPMILLANLNNQHFLGLLPLRLSDATDLQLVATLPPSDQGSQPSPPPPPPKPTPSPTSPSSSAPAPPVKGVRPGTLSVEALKLFTDLVRAWACSTTSDSRERTIAAYNYLQHFLASNATAIDPKARTICVIGPQSSSKTTIVLELTQQVVFLTSARTGTKVRTNVSCFYLDQPGGGHSFSYKNIQEENLSSDQLFKLHCDTFQNEPINKNVASILLRASQPSFRLNVQDHPGFVPRAAAATLELAADTIRKHFQTGSDATGSLLLCHSILNTFDEGAWLDLDGLAVVPGEDFFIAVTRMDELSHPSIFNRVRDVGQAYLKTDGKYHMTALDILKLLEFELRSHPLSNGKSISPEAKVFFVASCSASADELRQRPESQRWDFFRNNPNNGRTRHEQEMRAKLLDHDKWQQQGLELLAMNAQEQAEFDARLGVENLRAALLARQYEYALQSVADVRSVVEAEAQRCARQLTAAHQASQDSRPLHLLIETLLKEHVRHAHTLHVSELRNEPNRPLKDIFDRLIAEGVIGWTTDEFNSAAESIAGDACFPPPNRRIDSFDETFEELQPECVQPAAKLHTSQAMLRRFLAEFGLRAALILFPETDRARLLAGVKGAISSGTVNFAEVLTHFLVSEYENTFTLAEGRRGNHYAASRAALAVLCHSQTVCATLRELPEFRSLLPSDFDLLKYAQIFHAPKAKDRSKPPANVPAFNRNQPVMSLTIEKFCRVALSLIDNAAAVPEEEKAPPSPSPPSPSPPSPSPPTPSPATKNKPPPSPSSPPAPSPDPKKQPRRRVPAKIHRPDQDIAALFVAMHFHGPYSELLQKLDERANELSLQLSSSLVTAADFAKLFLHQDPKFLEEYAKQFPEHDYSKSILQKVKKPDGSGEKNPLADLVKGLGEIGGGLKDIFALGDIGIGAAMGGLPGAGSAVLKGITGGADPVPPLVPSSSSPSERSLFSGIQNMDLLRAIVFAQGLDAKSRAFLWRDLLDAHLSPDNPVAPQRHSNLNDFEQHSANYAVQRTMSAAIFWTLTSTTKTLFASQFRLAHPGTMFSMLTEAQQRFASILLGYEYPYATAERPAHPHYLDPRQVIPFLRRYSDWLVVRAGGGNARAASSAPLLLSTDINFAQSPLVQCVADMVRRGDHEMAIATIARLWEHFEFYEPDGEAEINKLLIERLVPFRYRQYDNHTRLQEDVRKAHEMSAFWNEAAAALDSYREFLEQHGGKIGGFNTLPAEILRLRPAVPQAQDLLLDSELNEETDLTQVELPSASEDDEEDSQSENSSQQAKAAPPSADASDAQRCSMM